MKHIRFQVTVSIITCVLLVLLIVVIVNTTHSRSVLTKEFEEKMFYYTEAYAHQLSEGFARQQETVDNMQIYVRNMFLMSDYEENTQLFNEKHSELDRIIKQLAKDNPGLASVYFTFDTERSKGKDEIWYARIDGKIVKSDYSEFEGMWDTRNSVTESSYYNALEKSPVWGNIYYEPVLKSQVLSYVTAVYDSEDKLIGVAGVDIRINDILGQVEKINSNKFGNAILTYSNREYITGNLKKSEYDAIRSLAPVKEGLDSNQKTGIINYKLEGEKMLMAYASLSNGWTLMVNQPQNKVLAPITSIQYMIIICAAIVLLLSVIFALYYSKRKLDPLVHEYEEKDIFIHAQTRSAKLGEMLSNIAHQWKQPLNSMTINITNMKDDFHDDALDPVRFDDYIERLKNTISNMSDTVDDFANFLKPDKEKEVFNINNEVKQVLNIIAPMINKQSIIVKTSGDDAWGYGFKNEYGQVLFNVINNAVDALKNSDAAQKQIEIKIEGIHDKMSTVRIFNNGSRISPEVCQKIFEPYFSTKKEDRATGLGLYMSREIIEENMDGNIAIYNAEGGVECMISIPGRDKHDISE